MKADVIPVVLFAYSRPDHLQRTLDCLRENQIPLLYAFSDAPRTPDKTAAVNEVRSILRAIDWCEVVLTERETNLGLGRSIITGVTEVLQKHEMVLVSEDDLIFVKGSYNYLCAALRHYADDPHVMSVTGWTHPRVLPSDITNQPYFDGRAECLLWGTWRRVWEGMEIDALTKIEQCRAKGIDVYRYGADLVNMAQQERVRNIWAVRFLYHHILNRGVAFRPPWSMVEHIGYDAQATNAQSAEGWDNPPLQDAPLIPTVFPSAVENSECAELWQQSLGRRPTWYQLTGSAVKRSLKPLFPYIPKSVRQFVKYRLLRYPEPLTYDYQIVNTTDEAISPEKSGWHTPKVAQRQHEIYQGLLREMYQGKVRQDFAALIEAIHLTKMENPKLIEVGCASGYYTEVLTYLLKQSFQYTGLDFSQALIQLARQEYPQYPFLVGDATCLPFENNSFDIVINGCSLIHIPDYHAAIAEAARVAHQWVIFYSLPIVEERPTLFLQKKAYGGKTVEIIFNLQEFRGWLAEADLEFVQLIETLPYDLKSVLGVPTREVTILCRKKLDL